MRVYITQKDKVKELFLADKKLLGSKTTMREGHKVTTNWYKGFHTIDVENIITLYYIPEDSEVIPFNSHFNVTKNSKYSLSNILHGGLTKTNIIIEGSDGTGKTTLVNWFSKYGFLMQDREIDSVCSIMKEYVKRTERIRKVKTFLDENPYIKVVFLYVSSEQELLRRITKRGNISIYDKEAIPTQRLYLETFDILNKECNNLFLIDTFEKTTEEVAEEVKRRFNLDLF